MADNSTKEAFANLTPDNMLDAIEATGIRCDGRFLALNSYENRVYQVGIEDEQPIVAKFYRPHRWSDDSIIEEHQFTLKLAEQEIPVVPPIVNAESKSLLHHGAYRFALYPRRGGHELELDNPEHLEQLGRFIGRIHAFGATTPFKHRTTLNIESLAKQPRDWLLSNNFIPEHLLEAYSSVTADLIQHIEIAYKNAGRIQQIRLHGDCHPGNILWRDNTPHIVDFDDARMGPAIQDLWMFLSGDRDYMTARLADLLEGYTQFYEFNPVELQLIEPLRTLRIINYAYWLASRWDDPAFPRAFPWFNTTRYWEDHVLELREQSALLNEPSLIWN